MWIRTIGMGFGIFWCTINRGDKRRFKGGVGRGGDDTMMGGIGIEYTIFEDGASIFRAPHSRYLHPLRDPLKSLSAQEASSSACMT